MAITGPPNLQELAYMASQIRHLGVREFNMGDAWRARWTQGADLPRGVPVIRVLAALYLEDKAYVIRPRGDDNWGTFDGTPGPAEKPLAFLRRALRDWVGATPGRVELIGYFHCVATSHNPEYAVGAEAVVPFYLVAAKTVKDVPRASPYERRRLPINEHIVALRLRYPEFFQELGEVAERYVVLRARGEL